MQRYFLFFSYDGTAYHGWQIQPNGCSVQETLMTAVRTLLRKPDIQVVGAGRTDTGVHAHLMAAHFDAGEDVNTTWLKEKLNRILPKDIAISRVCPVTERAHARFDALSRTYYYYVHTQKSPFVRHYSLYLAGHILPDFDRMNQAAAMLPEYNDFTSFSKLHTDAKTNLCNVTLARWVRLADTEWRFEITANRFLRNMVRAVVGTLFDVGYGRLDLDGFRRVIEGKDRCIAGSSVPAHALFLEDIVYPDTIFINKE